MMYQTDMMSDSTTFAGLAIDGSQPAWMTLNAARELAFTGEIVFETETDVRAYLDNGIVYYAERVTDATLGRRLLDAGVLDMVQLDRGTVRVGDIEHLGRLFDRDPSVDRDAVTVLAETATQELIADLASRTVTAVHATAYRHHPSGVHRWFVAPSDPLAVTRPLSTVAQIDTSVVSQLPNLPFGSGVEELTIEWDEPTLEWNEPAVDWDDTDDEDVDDDLTADVDMTLTVEEADDHTVELVVESFEPPLGLAEFTGDPTKASTDLADAVDTDTDTIDIDIDIVDIDDTIDALIDTDTLLVDDSVTVDDSVDVVDTVTVVALDESDESEFVVVWPEGPDEHESADDTHHLYVADMMPVLIRTEDGNIQFVMPPLALSDEPEQADADVPADVAAAVRSVIAAIESAGAADPATNAGMTHRIDAAASLPDLVSIEPSGPMTVGPAAFGGFAPPTLATSAHVLYGQPTTDGAAGGVATLAPAAPAGVAAASATDASDDRSSALRRLIGSLRRKEH